MPRSYPANHSVKNAPAWLDTGGQVLPALASVDVGVGFPISVDPAFARRLWEWGARIERTGPSGSWRAWCPCGELLTLPDDEAEPFGCDACGQTEAQP